MDNNDINKTQVEDDGTLAFLNLPRPEGPKQFHCELISLNDLVNQTVWIVDYEPNVKTKYGADRYLVLIKYDLNDPKDKAKKFFTTSVEIKATLDKIKELNKFPRKVTVKKFQRSIWFE